MYIRITYHSFVLFSVPFLSLSILDLCLMNTIAVRIKKIMQLSAIFAGVEGLNTPAIPMIRTLKNTVVYMIRDPSDTYFVIKYGIPKASRAIGNSTIW